MEIYTYFFDKGASSETHQHVLAKGILEADKHISNMGLNPLKAIVSLGLTLKVIAQSKILIIDLYPLVKDKETGELVVDENATPEKFTKCDGVIEKYYINNFSEFLKTTGMMEFLNGIEPNSYGNVVVEISGKSFDLTDVHLSLKKFTYVNLKEAGHI